MKTNVNVGISVTKYGTKLYNNYIIVTHIIINYCFCVIFQTCVHFMSYKFLKETVIGDPLIQSNIAAVSMVTEALQCQETSKETLKQETIPKNSKGKV